MSENLEEAQIDLTPAKKPRKTTKPYVPQLRSGPYAILLALASIGENECVSKQQLIDMAQPHCDASFVAPKDTTSFHTAWSSMKTLLNKDLVKERRGPQKRYELTDEGWEVAEKIKKVEKGDVGNADAGYGRETVTSGVAESNSRAKEKDRGKANAADRPKEATSRFRSPLFLLDDDDLWPSATTDTARPRLPLVDCTDLNVPQISSSAAHRLGGAVTDKYGTLPSSKSGKGHQASQKTSLPISKLRAATTELGDGGRLAARLRAEEVDLAKAAGSDVDFIELLSSPPPQAAIRPQSYKSTVPPRTERPSAPRESLPSREASIVPEPTVSRPLSSTTFTPPNFQPIKLPPSAFTIELILDNREIRSREDRTYIETQLLQNHSIRPLIRSLPLGDFFWVAKLKNPSLLPQHGEEGELVALDYIVERKRLDDLIASIKDGRFREQKFRLRRSGARNVVYLVEEIGISQETKSKYWAAMQTAIASTQVVDGFTVKRTRGLDESIRYLARMTRLLKSIHEVASSLIPPFPPSPGR